MDPLVHDQETQSTRFYDQSFVKITHVFPVHAKILQHNLCMRLFSFSSFAFFTPPVQDTLIMCSEKDLKHPAEKTPLSCLNLYCLYQNGISKI